MARVRYVKRWHSFIYGQPPPGCTRAEVFKLRSRTQASGLLSAIAGSDVPTFLSSPEL